MKKEKKSRKISMMQFEDLDDNYEEDYTTNVPKCLSFNTGHSNLINNSNDNLNNK